MIDEIRVGNEKMSLDRPAWTQDDLNAYNHKHSKIKMVNYFVKTKGLDKAGK